MNKTINLKIDETSELIILDNLIDSENFEINYSDDIDFTELIRKLSNMIDEGNELSLELEEREYEGKLEIIIETIKSIFEKYNESLAYEIETEESREPDDLPF
jgi:hypothetical protein